MNCTDKLEWEWKLFKRRFYNMLRFFKNIYVFRKTLYNSAWWDYSGYLQAMDDMLTHQIKHFESDKNSSLQRKKAKHMRVIRELIRRQRESNQADWWDCEIKSTPLENGMFVLKIKTTKKCSVVPADTKMSRKIRNGIEQQEWDYLFKLLHKHLRNFWD